MSRIGLKLVTIIYWVINVDEFNIPVILCCCLNTISCFVVILPDLPELSSCRNISTQASEKLTPHLSVFCLCLMRQKGSTEVMRSHWGEKAAHLKLRFISREEERGIIFGVSKGKEKKRTAG